MSSLAPPGALVAGYADVVDGRSLLLDLGGADGTPAVRVDDGDTVPLTATVEESHGHRALRADLAGATALPRDREWAGDVVLLDERGRPRPVRVPPAVGEGPTLAPLTPDGRRFLVRRSPDGVLRLRHRPAVRFVEALAYDASDTEVSVLLPPTVEGDLLLVADDGVLATFPLERDGRTARARLTVAGLSPPAERVPTSVGVGTPDAWVPVGRRANALADPGDQAVPLPVVHDADTGAPRLRLRHRPGGLLAAVLLPREAGGGS